MSRLEQQRHGVTLGLSDGLFEDETKRAIVPAETGGTLESFDALFGF